MFWSGSVRSQVWLNSKAQAPNHNAQCIPSCTFYFALLMALLKFFVGECLLLSPESGSLSSNQLFAPAPKSTITPALGGVLDYPPTLVH